MALATAFALAEYGPISALDFLTAAQVVNRTTTSGAFAKWVSMSSYSPPDVIKASEPGGYVTISLDKYLGASYRVAEEFFRRDNEIWGRDFITLALLTVADPKLDSVEGKEGRNLQQIRDEWFRFVSSDKTFGDRRPWADWWKKAGVPLPGESVRLTSQATPVSQAATAVPDVWMVADRPIENDFENQDRFRFVDYAKALATVIDHANTEIPFTMAINAPWGAGKTTLAKMIEDQLRKRTKDRGHPEHIVCWFNAWMHDDASNLATAFVSEVSRRADRHRTAFWRLLNPLPSAVLEPDSRKWRRTILIVVILLLAGPTLLWVGSHLERLEARKKYESSMVETHQVTATRTEDPSGKEISESSSDTKTESKKIEPPPKETVILDAVDHFLDKSQSRLAVLGAFFTAVVGIVAVVAKLWTTTSLGAFVQAPDKAADSGAIDSARQQLENLIAKATWRGNRFIVFVDDIERCKPPRSIDVMDVVNQLMSHKGVIVVFLGDMSAVAAAAQLKYKDLAEFLVPNAGTGVGGPDRAKEAFGRLYLQKIIQFQFDLPIPPTAKIQEYMNQLTVTPQAGGRPS